MSKRHTTWSKYVNLVFRFIQPRKPCNLIMDYWSTQSNVIHSVAMVIQLCCVQACPCKQACHYCNQVRLCPLFSFGIHPFRHNSIQACCHLDLWKKLLSKTSKRSTDIWSWSWNAMITHRQNATSKKETFTTSVMSEIYPVQLSRWAQLDSCSSWSQGSDNDIYHNFDPHAVTVWIVSGW